MTHNELLTKMDVATPSIEMSKVFYHALRAVVKLHKPVYRGCNESWCCGSYDECACGEAYPCTTIEAIEKELK